MTRKGDHEFNRTKICAPCGRKIKNQNLNKFKISLNTRKSFEKIYKNRF